MQEAVQAGFRPELISASPHSDSFRAFINPSAPENSGLHALLQELFPWDIQRAGKDEQPTPRVEYLDYRVANLPRQQPGREFSEAKRTYECLLKIRLAIREGERREEKEYLLARLPWITARDTFVRNGLEIVPLAQLLPATGILFARKKRPESKAGEEWIADIRPAHGPGLRLRCRQSAKGTDTQALLLASVQVGHSKRKNVWQFFRDLFGPDSRDFQGFADRLGQLFTSVDEEELTPEETEQREVEAEALYRQLFNVKVLGGFDFGAAGRTQFNRRLSPAFSHLSLTPSSGRELTPEDLLAALHYLAALVHGKDAPFATVVDDLEHLANKRVRLVGDFLADDLWWSLLKAREEACSALRYYGEIGQELERCFLGVDETMQKVFALGPLFQLLDTTNPLAAVSHKRTVTLRGPGGIESEFGNLEKRDVHPSHYGRLCPCETPESEDIGLTLHLATYAQVQDGHLVTPVNTPGKNGDVIWLRPEEENNLSLCTRQELSPERRREGRMLTRRYAFSGIPATPTYNEAAYVKEEEIAYHDIALEQQLGLPACLVPFLRHSDANRVLMGAKNLKQALPLLKPEVPLVRTGMEEVVASLHGEDPAGAQEERKAIVDGKLTLGRNLLVAYMPWRGYNFEDAIVASERLVKEDVLTTVHYDEVTRDIPPSERVQQVVKVGTSVHAGDVLVRTAHLKAVRHDLMKTKAKKQSTMDGGYRENSLVYETTTREYPARPGEEGEVIETKLIADSSGRVTRILIRLKRVCPLTIGDKLMGRHGNKGVVGKIVPEAQMPTLPDGTPVDLVLNPHGVVSRMNLGQLYETHLAWVLRHRERLAEVERARVPEVLSPFQTIDHTELSRWLVQTGLDHKGKIKLKDGANGPEFENPVVVGYQYVVKLDHRPEDKLTVRQIGPYAAITKQPVKGKKQGGGQRIGEMESWALQVHQVPQLLEEFLTTKADDVIRRLEMQKLLDTALDRLDANVPPAHLPESLRVAFTLLQASGIVAFPAQGESQSTPLPFPFPLRSDKLGLLSWRFGDEADLLVWDHQGTLTAFGQQLLGAGRSPSRSAEVQQPGTFDRVAYVQLQCGCEGFDDEVVIRQGRKWFCQQHQKDYFAHLQRRTHRWRPVRGGLYDAEIFGVNPYLIGDQGTEGDRETREKAWRERFGYIRLACEVENPLTKRPITFLPILPPAFRFRLDPEDPARHRLDRPGKKSLDWHYARIVRINNALRNPAQTGLYTEEDLQEAIGHLFRGYEGGKEGDCLERLIKGKHGIFRQAVLGKRTDYSGRAVIVPDPELALNECRLPYHIGVQLFWPWLKQALLTAGRNIPVIDKILSAQPSRKKTHRRAAPPLSVNEVVERILTAPEEPKHRQAIAQVWPEALRIDNHQRVCILNRAPTLHKFNVLAFSPRLWNEAVIAIPPLVCAGYNADFDGDTMAVHVPLTAESQREARERLSPATNLFSPVNGRLILHLAQDIIAGLAHRQIKESGTLPPTFAQALRERIAQTDDVVQEALACMREGFAQATQAGLSFGLFDIPLVENRQALLQAQLTSVPLAAFYAGTLSAEEREGVGENWKKRVTKEMERQLKEGLERQPINALALLTVSRARGDAETITQLGGMRGLMQRGSTEYTAYPIEANFVEGLSPLEFFFSTFGSRASLVDKKLKVADAGDFTRRLVNCAYNMRISCDDCKTTTPRSVLTCTASDGICQLCYGEELDTKQLPPVGRPVGLIAATSIGERGTQLSMRTFHTGGVKGDNITRGLPHVDALLENRWVDVPYFSLNGEEFHRWEKHLREARSETLNTARQLTGKYIRLRLGEVARTVEEARTIVLGEVYQSYKRDDLKDPRLFEVILRAMIRWENGRPTIRGLTQAARENLFPLERIAFRDAIGRARANAEQRAAKEITGAQEKVMVANL